MYGFTMQHFKGCWFGRRKKCCIMPYRDDVLCAGSVDDWFVRVVRGNVVFVHNLGYKNEKHPTSTNFSSWIVPDSKKVFEQEESSSKEQILEWITNLNHTLRTSYPLQYLSEALSSIKLRFEFFCGGKQILRAISPPNF